MYALLERIHLYIKFTYEHFYSLWLDLATLGSIESKENICFKKKSFLCRGYGIHIKKIINM